MKYVTMPMLVRHTGKNRVTILRAMKRAGIEGEQFPGARGKRYTVGRINTMLLRQWPEVGVLPENWIRSSEG